MYKCKETKRSCTLVHYQDSHHKTLETHEVFECTGLDLAYQSKYLSLVTNSILLILAIDCSVYKV